MTNEQMERAMEFILNQQAQTSANIDRLTGDVQNLTTDVQSLKEAQAQTSKNIADLTGVVASLAAQAESDRQEIREAIDKLIIANEVTRDLAQQVAKLEVQTSQRVTDIDHRVTDLESKQ